MGSLAAPADAGERWLAARARATPEAPALFFGEKRWSYAELDGAVATLAAQLSAAGVVAGARLAALLPGDPAYVYLIHAAARLGAVLVPLNGRLTSAELRWQYEHVEQPWLVAGPDTLATARTVAPPGRILNLASDGDLSRVETAEPPPPLAVEPALQAIVFTSGTSGRPKGARITFGNHFYSAFASATRLGLAPHDLWLSCLPLYHVGGLAVIWRSCLYGTAVDLHSRFDAPTISRRLDDLPITLISLVPTMLRRLLDARDSWPESLRLILLGGAAATPDLIAAANARAARPIVAATYGLTEAASQVATAPPDETAAHPGTVGRPLPFTTVTIVDGDGQPHPPGTPGEIVVQGATVSPGYFVPGSSMSPDTGTEASIATGDIGALDETGRLTIYQRRSDLIVSGGENVYPAEVENVLRRFPGVRDVAVVGIADPEWGQRVAALVVGDDVDVSALEAYARHHLAGFKIPRVIQFAPSLPLTASGKVARAAIADSLARDAA